MTAALLCRFPLVASFLEVYTGSRDQWSGVSSCTLMVAFLGGVTQWRLGARCVETWRPMCGEGLAQEGDVIRRRGGVHG